MPGWKSGTNGVADFLHHNLEGNDTEPASRGACEPGTGGEFVFCFCKQSFSPVSNKFWRLKNPDLYIIFRRII